MTVRPGELTRQQLYDRIRESSKDEVILEEMIRLGFWKAEEEKPDAPEELIRRRGEIRRELAELGAQDARWGDTEAAIREMHRRRKKQALERRKETKKRNATARHERALAWHERRNNDILYLGETVSAGLHTDADGGQSKPKPGLHDLATPKALAVAMGVELAELRFLAYDRALSRISHYQRFTIPKKTGGQRLISAPMPRLKRAQYWILDNILVHAKVHDAAQGFVPGRSIVTNASAHTGRDVVVNLDLQDFFPTLDFRRIKGKFRGLGYCEPVATVLALLCTEPDVDELEIDGERLFAARGPRRLPQGAPTSPMLTNLICSRLDNRLAGLANSLGFTYTRYADDMTFSASGHSAGKAGALIGLVHEIVANEGFIVHPDKTRIMRRGSRQEVTGLTVNDRVAVPRDVLRRFRALLHGISASGPEGKRWGQAQDVMDAARGFASFVHMVTPQTGGPLIALVDDLEKRHGRQAVPVTAERTFRTRSAASEQPLERWWTPAEPPLPPPDPVLFELEPASQPHEEPPRSALDIVGLRAQPSDRLVQGSKPLDTVVPEDEGQEEMSLFKAAVGIMVLTIAGFMIHPVVGRFVLFMAAVIWLKRKFQRWRQNRRDR